MRKAAQLSNTILDKNYGTLNGCKDFTKYY